MGEGGESATDLAEHVGHDDELARSALRHLAIDVERLEIHEPSDLIDARQLLESIGLEDGSDPYLDLLSLGAFGLDGEFCHAATGFLLDNLSLQLDSGGGASVDGLADLTDRLESRVAVKSQDADRQLLLEAEDLQLALDLRQTVVAVLAGLSGLREVHGVVDLHALRGLGEEGLQGVLDSFVLETAHVERPVGLELDQFEEVAELGVEGRGEVAELEQSRVTGSPEVELKDQADLAGFDFRECVDASPAHQGGVAVAAELISDDRIIDLTVQSHFRHVVGELVTADGRPLLLERPADEGPAVGQEPDRALTRDVHDHRVGGRLGDDQRVDQVPPDERQHHDTDSDERKHYPYLRLLLSRFVSILRPCSIA